MKSTIFGMLFMCFICGCSRVWHRESLLCQCTVESSSNFLSTSILAKDSSASSIATDTIKLNTLSVRTIGFQPILLCIMTDAECDKPSAAEFLVQTRGHSRLYLINDNKNLYLYFEVVSLPVQEDHRMSDDVLWWLFYTHKNVFTLVDTCKVYIESGTAEYVESAKISLPNNYVIVPVHSNKERNEGESVPSKSKSE